MYAWDDKESPNARIERVVKLRPGWVEYDYRYRGEELRYLNRMEYVGSCKLVSTLPNADPPLKNYRYYMDFVEYADINRRHDAAFEQATLAEIQEMPPTADPHQWFLEHFQLKECAQCGTKDGDLSTCSGCRSFVYCCKEHQTAHWKSEHKYVCLKRKDW